jgi:hypothetical protein
VYGIGGADVASSDVDAVRAHSDVVPGRMSHPAPAPELDQTIDAALAELDQSITEAKLHNDPLRLPLMALASFLRMQRQLHASVVETIEDSVPRQPSDVGRRLLGACQAWSKALVQFALVRSWAGLGAIMLVVAVLGFGAGWFYRGPALIGAGITGGTPRCGDQPDGSRLCWIRVFERPVPRKDHADDRSHTRLAMPRMFAADVVAARLFSWWRTTEAALIGRYRRLRSTSSVRCAGTGSATLNRRTLTRLSRTK